MANYCDYEMKVYGSKENIKEFIDIIKADYNTDEGTCTAKRHMWRVFEAVINSDNDTDETIDDDIINVKDSLYVCDIYGYCAWSVYSCMLEGHHSYHDEFDKDDPEHNSSLLNESKILSLYIEVFSKEPGVGFTEHYRIFNGNILFEEEKEYTEHYFDTQDEIDEYNKENNTNYTLDNYDEILNKRWYDDDYEDKDTIIGLYKMPDKHNLLINYMYLKNLLE